MALANKFIPLIEFEEKEDCTYHLLPFRFVKLENDKYVVTNFVGEYLILHRRELDDLVHKRILSNTPLFYDLTSKHFISDSNSTVATDLLALKFRTKQHANSFFTSLHIFVVTLRCDYTCKYCQVSRQTEDKDSFDMTAITAENSLKHMFMSPNHSLKVEFQGGESLLNFPLIKHIVLKAKEINQTAKRNLQFVISTNLSFIDDEILAFCKEHSIHISTSLDGPEWLHNKNRPRPGKNGYATTISGIKKTSDFLGPDYVSPLMTTTEASLNHVKEIIDEYVSLGMHSIFLRPLSPYGFAVRTKQLEKYQMDRWLEFYKDGLEYILELNRNGYAFVEQYAAIILTKILSNSNSGYVDLQSPAGVGISAIVFNYDGRVFISDEARMLAEMGDNTFCIGDINLNTYEEIMLSPTLLDTLEQSATESLPTCNDCGFLPYCGTDPVYHHATQGNIVGLKAESGFCKKNMEIMKYLFKLMEDQETKLILQSWIRC